jgi:histidine ammonia-lyase
MIQIDGEHLTIDQVYQVGLDFQPVSLSDQALIKIKESHQRVQQIVDSGEPVYGINTGYGIFADKNISLEDIRTLNRNLILSHAVGTGEPLPIEVVRAAVLIRANTLAKGYSGVRPEIITTLLDILNKKVHPVIPSQGSLGSSGDLAPLSHLALVISTDQQDLDQESGLAEYQGKVISGKKAMKKAGLSRLILGAKEGIALNNGASFSAAIAALICAEARIILKAAQIAMAMSLEALRGKSDFLDPQIHLARQHPGQISVAENILQLIQNSTLVDSRSQVQDPYSLRCSPQVLGPILETLDHTAEVVFREINAATDNPLIFMDGRAISGGNFHGEPISLFMDYLGIALTELGGISERRIYKLTTGPEYSNLPPMLVDGRNKAGLNSGMMMPQYTAAALVLENRSLATPDSIFSLPTSGGQEDHNANAMTAARHTRQILKNTRHIIALELFVAASALELQISQNPDEHLGIGTSAAYQTIRDSVPYQAGDRLLDSDIELVHQLISTKTLNQAVQAVLPDLS